MAFKKNPDRFGPEGITFDDVLLVPGYSDVLPREVITRTKLTKKIWINIPLVSAAMDTVTEYNLAIALARAGGIGVIHKNMSIQKQAEQVRKVKRADSGLIIDPITLTQGSTVAQAKKLMTDNKINGILIVDAKGKLIGILTNRDLRFEKNENRLIREVMTDTDLKTAPKGTTMKGAEKYFEKYKVKKLPVVDKDGILVGLYTSKDIQKIISNPLASKDKKGRLLCGAAVGVTNDILKRIEALTKEGVDVVFIDTAHGHSRGVLAVIKQVKKTFPALEIVGGNVATKEGAAALIRAGVDGIKVGVGPGSICTTRIVAGVGVPQLSAIAFAAEAAKGTNVPIIADGGIRYTGDVVKALAAGANTVMAGGIFAGTDESPGETILYEGRKFKSYRGMGSVEAMQDGSKDRYFQDAEDDIKKLVPEGIVGRVPYKGTVAEVVNQYVGGLRAGMGYCGAKTIEALHGARFIRITSAGINESHPHDVTITREAPNYTRK